jgi:hypothetical protein
MSCNQDGKIVISDQFRDAIKESVFGKISEFMKPIESWLMPDGSIENRFSNGTQTFTLHYITSDNKLEISDELAEAIRAKIMPKDVQDFSDAEKDYQDDPNKNKVIKDQFWEKINKWDKWFTELEGTRIYKFSSCDNEGITLKN